MSQGRDEEDLAKQAEYMAEERDELSAGEREGYTGTEREEYLETLLDLLTPQDVRLLVHAEDELSQTKVLVTLRQRYLYLSDQGTSVSKTKVVVHLGPMF